MSAELSDGLSREAVAEILALPVMESAHDDRLLCVERDVGRANAIDARPGVLYDAAQDPQCIPETGMVTRACPATNGAGVPLARCPLAHVDGCGR